MTRPDAGPWSHPLLAEGLPAGLPPRALTVLDVGGEEHPGHWPTLGPPLTGAAIGRSQSVLFVQAGGQRAIYANGRGLAQERSELFGLERDDDLVVYGPPSQLNLRSDARPLQGAVTADGRPFYNCHIPTLHNARTALAVHEARYGPALLILDDVANARPYLSALPTDGGEELPRLGLSLSPSVVAGWLATDLLDLAESRPEAPTVVVWEDAPSLPGRAAAAPSASARPGWLREQQRSGASRPSRDWEQKRRPDRLRCFAASSSGRVRVAGAA